MEIRWTASFSASCVHAVLCREQGFAAADGELADLIDEPAEVLIASIRENNLDVVATLTALEALASEFDNNRQLVEITLTRLHGGSAEHVVSQIAAAIGILESKLLAARPEMVKGLALRSRPLQEQWQARGPGLLRQLAKLTDDSFVAPSAAVVLVTPWVGGHGRADLKANRVLFEAVLANPHDDMPETLRLGWLLAQLQADVPIYSEAISTGALERMTALATVPAILSAAQEVEWATCDAATITRALSCWYPDALPFADGLTRWWQAYEGGNRSWAVAWRALEPLLGESARVDTLPPGF
jgi:hypothetical protein